MCIRDRLYIVRTLGGKFLEKKIFEKRYLNVFPRWDYKVACYSPANLVNINPLYTEQSCRTPILVLLSNDALINGVRIGVLEVRPQTLTEPPKQYTI